MEWEGALTLPAVQCACLEVAQCFVKHAYPRVLNNDIQLSSLPREAAPWLARHFFPTLKLAGIKQLAWVHAPIVRGLSHATQLLQQLPHLKASLFADMEQAASWLQQSNPAYETGRSLLPRPLAEETLLARTVVQLQQTLEAMGVIAEGAATAA